jgi:hypothetical protein
MLESFEIKRNTDGSYALTHELNDNVGVAYTDDKTENEIFLYTDATATNKNQEARNYNVENNKLNLVFTDENNNILPKLSITDDDTYKKSDDIDLLDTYSVVFNEDGTVKLDFKVEPGVAVDFGYNYDENIHDIYLSEGTSSQLDYSKNYTKESDGTLRIDFVQTSNKATDTKKPRVIFTF